MLDGPERLVVPAEVGGASGRDSTLPGYVLNGSVREMDGGVRITARIVRADTGTQIWSAAYDEPLDTLRSAAGQRRVARLDRAGDGALRADLRCRARARARHGGCTTSHARLRAQVLRVSPRARRRPSTRGARLFRARDDAGAGERRGVGRVVVVDDGRLGARFRGARRQ